MILLQYQACMEYGLVELLCLLLFMLMWIVIDVDIYWCKCLLMLNASLFAALEIVLSI